MAQGSEAEDGRSSTGELLLTATGRAEDGPLSTPGSVDDLSTGCRWRIYSMSVDAVDYEGEYSFVDPLVHDGEYSSDEELYQVW